MTAGYALAAPLYRQAGWAGTLPLPPRAKSNPPSGYTGVDGADPTDQQVATWALQHDGGNLALRLPDGIIGIDLDLYKDPGARERLHALIGCQLPPTIASTSKLDGSGIYLYRTPPLPQGKRYLDAPVEAVEVIQHGHRYAVVWPSVHPDGPGYFWWDTSSGERLDGPPPFDDDRIADLPYQAVLALLTDRNAYDERQPVDLTFPPGDPSPKVRAKLDEGLGVCIRAAGGRHDRIRDIVAALVRLGDRGEPGVDDALASLRESFVVYVGRDRPSTHHAAKEFDDLVSGAVRIVSTTESTVIDVPDLTVLGPADHKPAAADAHDAYTPDEFFVDWHTLFTRELTGEEWLLEPILARGRAHVVYAPHKVGKSLLSLWAALKLATGDEPVVVVYLDYEMGEDDLHERVEDMGYGPDHDLSRLRYALLPSLPPLDTPDGGNALMAIVDNVQEDWPDHHLVVIVDTTGRAVSGEENSADTIRAFYRETGIRLKQRKCTWLRLDHAGKDKAKGQRGSSAKGDDVDLVWLVEQIDGKGLKLTRNAARMGWVPETVTLLRNEDPLRYTVANGAGWPEGTAQKAAEMRRAGVTPQMSQTAAVALFREKGGEGRGTLLRAAYKHLCGTLLPEPTVLPDVPNEPVF